jgi:hypothetical protein
MRVYKKEKVEQEVLAHIQCDLCGTITEDSAWYADGDSGCKHTVEICHQKSESYCDCGNGTNRCVDLCPDCFEKKLVPWVESQGGTVHDNVWD